jgi:hypothetical protein
VSSLILLVLLGGGVAGVASYYQQRQRQQEITLQTRIRSLSDENELLARELQSMKVLMGKDAEQRRIEKQVSSLRGLPFTKKVYYKRITRQELPAYLIQELRSEYTEEEFKKYLESLAVMGFLPKDINLEKLLLDLLGEQVAAFYDPKKGELFTFETFDINRLTDQVIYAHEVTHALQDQNFDLNKNTPILRKDNDDRVMAAKALIEGDATLLMNLYLMGNFDPVKFFSNDLFHMLGQPVEKLAAAPSYLRESLLFAYQQGQEFCTRLFDEGGFSRIDEAFKNLPESTEQIIHPDKFLARNDPPVELTWAAIPDRKWEKIGDNVAGELGVRLLLAEQLPAAQSTQAAEGWGGDRYQVFVTSPDKHAVIWWSQWDTEKDAKEFFKAYVAFFVKRNGLPPVDQGGETNGVLLTFGGRQQSFVLRDKSVLILDVPTPKDVEALMTFLWQKKQEK